MLEDIVELIKSQPLPDIRGAYDAHAVVERFRDSLLVRLRQQVEPAVASGGAISGDSSPDCLPTGTTTK